MYIFFRNSLCVKKKEFETMKGAYDTASKVVEIQIVPGSTPGAMMTPQEAVTQVTQAYQRSVRQTTSIEDKGKFAPKKETKTLQRPQFNFPPVF